MINLPKIIDKILLGVTALIIFTTPLLPPPVVNTFVLISGCILLLLWAIRNALTNRNISQTPRALFILTAAIFISIFLNPSYMSGLVGRGMLFAGLSLIYFVIVQVINEGKSEKLIGWITGSIIASATFLAIANILQILGVLEKIMPQSISLARTPFSQAGFILIALVLSSTKLLQFIFEPGHEQHKMQPPSQSAIETLTYGVTIPILAASLVIFTSTFVTAPSDISQASSTAYLQLPFPSGWQIATRVLGENLKSAFLGVGPGNFGPAFLTFKPFQLLRTPFWNNTFTKSSNEPLHLLTTTGILGFGSWLWILIQFAKHLALKARSRKKIEAGEIGLATAFLAQIVLPPNQLSWLALFALMGANTSRQSDKKCFKLAPATLLAVVGVITSSLIYLSNRAYAGEIKFNQAKKTNTYNLQLEAIKLNPKKAEYHSALARTSIALAQALSQQIKTAPEISEAVSEQTQNQAYQLVQQGINEAKIATRLAPNNAIMWANLAEIYRNLAGTIDGASDWAIIAYSSAINLDPLNLDLRINRGGIFYSAGNWEEAITNFKTTVQIRPEFANGWYNLAAAYRQSGQPEKATAALQETLKALSPDSPERSKVKEELKEASSSSKPE